MDIVYGLLSITFRINIDHLFQLYFFLYLFVLGRIKEKMEVDNTSVRYLQILDWTFETGGFALYHFETFLRMPI